MSDCAASIISIERNKNIKSDLGVGTYIVK